MLQTSVGHANGNVAAAGAKLRHRQPVADHLRHKIAQLPVLKAEQIEQISLILLLCVPGKSDPVYTLKHV